MNAQILTFWRNKLVKQSGNAFSSFPLRFLSFPLCSLSIPNPFYSRSPFPPKKIYCAEKNYGPAKGGGLNTPLAPPGLRPLFVGGAMQIRFD